jgi:hypothetical protein
MNDRLKSMKSAYPSRIPVRVGILPAAWMKHRNALDEIIPDLVECGVDVVNAQVGANGLENLAEVCKGKVCLDLDLDRQQFPFWSPADIGAHVKDAVETLGAPEGGLWLTAEVGDDIPLENVEAICSALEKYGTYYGNG